jgi:putative flavoprotein involved in K+ transport
MNIKDKSVAMARWLDEFAEALDRDDPEGAAALFAETSYWRDLVAFTWNIVTFEGRAAVADMLKARLADVRPHSFVVDGSDGWFSFETEVGRGRGHLRLKEGKAWTFFTALTELKGFEERTGLTREMGTEHGAVRNRVTWTDQRKADAELGLSHQPFVLIVGGGQGGMGLGARLKRLGVPTLIVDRHPRPGDAWRKRYKSLCLHDPVWYDHLPYLPFPPTWPVFTPKDKLGDWFESYAAAMELDVWTQTELLGASYDEAAGVWDVRLRRPDGEERLLRPAHLVLATGASGEPRVPEIPGLEDFRGTVSHSSAHPGGAGFAGRRAVVVGACNSGHDIAQDLHENGAEVTMVQRSSTYVLSSEHGIPISFAGLYEEGGPPTEDADLLFAAFPFALLAELNKPSTQAIADLDRDLLDGLERAGFALDFGDDGSGLLMKYLRRGGGYYIDVGCSRLIADGQVKVKQGVAIERFTETGLAFADGRTRDADVVVLATGYEDMRETARRLLGDEVADRCTPVWGLDEEGELRTIWRDSGHPGLWFMGGNLHLCRFFSRYLALRLKALEIGLRPTPAPR